MSDSQSHTFEINLELATGELVFEVGASVLPGSAPAPCQDPDHPAFHDPGQATEAELTSVRLVNEWTGQDKKHHRKVSPDIMEFLPAGVLDVLRVTAETMAMDVLDAGPDPDAAYEQARDDADDQARDK